MKAKLNLTKSAGLLSLLFALMAFVALGKVHAQSTGEIEGQVTDARTSEVLPGVNVIIVETEQGTATDAEGRYTIAGVEPGIYTLRASFVGYSAVTEEEVEVSEGEATTVNFEMDESMEALDEIVVVGYGTQEQVDLTGSVETVSAASIEGRTITNASQAIQGAKGVYVNQPSGQPGADDANIRIRGIGTLNNNDPLVLVDGIEGSLRDINPDDIESISILKDAAAASIYGNRAANGVVLVTTKSGQEGGIQVSYNNSVGWQQATYLPDVVTNSVDWLRSLNQAYRNEGQQAPYTEEQIEQYRNGIGNDPDMYPNTNWFDVAFRNALMHDHDVRISGGSDWGTIATSIGYLDQEGVMLGTDAKRYTFRSNIDLNISDRMEAGIIVSGTHWNRGQPAADIGSMMGSSITRSLPIDPVILSNGEYGGSWLEVPGRTWRHPLAWATEGFTNNKTTRGVIQLSAEYTFPFDLVYEANLSVNHFEENESRFIPEVNYYIGDDLDNPISLRMPGNRSSERMGLYSQDISFFQTAEWTGRILENHNLDLLGGFSFETFDESYFSSYVEGFLSNDLTALDAGSTNQDVSGTSEESSIMSYFGRLDYSYADRYLAQFNLRYDGSSRFADGRRWGIFPSASIGWRLDEEEFMNNIEFINDLKLRASWGKLGNQNVPLYSYVNSVGLGMNYTFNNNVSPGAAVTALADPNISWEVTTIKNLGLDAVLFGNRLEVSFEVFDKFTEDILTRVEVPAQVGGLEGPVTNLYSMRNKGAEIGISHSNLIGELRYEFGGNVTYTENNVEFLDGDEQYGNSTTWGDLTVIKEGYPVDSYYLLVADGIFRSQSEVDGHVNENGELLQPDAEPGDIRYRDVNGDGVLNSEDRIITGRSVPEYTFSFNVGLGFRGLDLSAQLQGVQGIDSYPTSNLVYPNHNGAGLTKDQLANSWSPENTDGSLPRLTLPKRGSQANYQLSTFWLRDASYLRIKNLQIGYSTGGEFLGVDVDRLRIFANAENLVTFSSFDIIDPERTITRSNIYEYPSVKSYTLGLNISF